MPGWPFFFSFTLHPKLDCSETLKKLQEELRLRGGWCDHTKKLSDELGLNQGVNITEVEEDDSWRGGFSLNRW